jgi:hypothetical protein
MACSFAQDLVKLNLGRLQEWIDKGRLNPSQPITMRDLLDSRACRGIKDGVKLLADVSYMSFVEWHQVFANINYTGKGKFQDSN